MIRRVLTKVLYAVGRITQVGCVVHVVTRYVAEPTLCIGQSMQPTINSTSRNDIVLTEHVSTHLGNLKVSDIVIVRSPQDPSISLCKRITAMEGDIVQPCVDDMTECRQIRVPKGHVWLSGDNTNNSVDSRTYGPVPSGLILGRVCYKLYPFSEFGPVK